jgi:UDP-N-acetylmuramoyl-L-alanyl-D-glutamate--2,6-diaminopimelate ligase
VALPMPGRFNVANALGALAAVHALGGELDSLVAALCGGARVPGRFEPVDEGQDFAVLVDYAHTPDSLENVLAAARELAASADERGQGRVICVFGAGGDRDRGKRPLMGEIAARLADVAVVTSDNPRSEEPEQIIAEIMAGVARVDRSEHPQTGAASQRPPVRSIADRGEAIAQAIADAHAGDVLVIAGKGHEQGQELAGGRKVPFDDVEVARSALRALNGSVERATA